MLALGSCLVRVSGLIKRVCSNGSFPRQNIAVHRASALFIVTLPSTLCGSRNHYTMREEDYDQATERPAKEVFDFRTSNCDQDENKVGGDERVVLRAKPEAGGHAIAWVIPNVLSLDECKEVIALGEDYGIAPSNKPVLRTSKRTDHYENQELSDRIFARVKPHCVPFCADTGNGDGMGTLHGIHHNWRIVRYDKGDAFPAHQDQMDSFQIKDPVDGTKDLIVSSHTVLLNLSSPKKVVPRDSIFLLRIPAASKTKRIATAIPWTCFYPQAGRWRFHSEARSMLASPFLRDRSTSPKQGCFVSCHRENCANLAPFVLVRAYRRCLSKRLLNWMLRVIRGATGCFRSRLSKVLVSS